jgi:hypothetical protein
MIDRRLLRQALSELVRLRGASEDPTRYLARLYSSALQEWARRLRVDPLRLNRMVLFRKAVSRQSVP